MFRSAVIGCGAVSKNHGKALKDNRYTTLEYCVDIEYEKAVAFSEKYGGVPLSDYRELFDKNIDVAHVVTPHNTHPLIVMDLLSHGINVFCEKPLAITVNEAKAMIRKSEETGKRLGVCFQNRMNKATVEAKEILESGKYGKILSGMALVTWYRNGSYYSESPWRGKYSGEGGGCIINQSIHTLDLVDYLTGGVESLSGFDGKLRDSDDYEVEDSAMALMKLKSGGEVVAFCSNCYLGSKVCDVELRLEKAVMTVRQSGLTIVEEDGNTIFHPSVVLTGEKSEWGVSHGVLIDEFYRSLRDGDTFIADCHTALAAVSIVNAIQHRKGRRIRIER